MAKLIGPGFGGPGRVHVSFNISNKNCANGSCGQMDELKNTWRYIGENILALYEDGNDTDVLVVLDGGIGFDSVLDGMGID